MTKAKTIPSKSKGFIVFNKTDGVLASPMVFTTKNAASTWIDKFKERIENLQGYYLTAKQERISLDDLELEINPA